MIYAAYVGHKDIVEYLVSQGADKDIKNDVSTTPVHVHLYNMIHICIYLSTRECMYIYLFFGCVNICCHVHSFVYLYSYIYA